MDSLASKITDSEAEIMRILWEAKEPLPIGEIREKLEKKCNWDSSTIKTLIRRLCEKGVVMSEKRKVFFYSPLVSEKEYNDYNTKLLIDKIYSGSAKNLVASLIGNKRLRDEDIEELRNMFKVGKKNG